MNRTETIKAIRKALRERSGKDWSVRGDRGTAYGWFTISSPPRRMDTNGWSMTDAERRELATLLGLDHIHHQGVSVPAGNDYYQEYIDRAAGREPSVIGTPYWD